MKKVAKDTFVHITCALFSELYNINDFEKMSITKSEKRIPKQNKECEYCKKSGNLMKCDKENCTASSHIYCALRARMGKNPKWICQFITKANSIKVTIDVEDIPQKETFETIYAKLEEAKIMFEGEENVHNIESQMSIENNNPKKSNKKIGKGQKENIPFLIYNEIKENLKGLRNSFPVGKEPRGGEVKLFCEDHKSEDLYCLCERPYNETSPEKRFMIGCESCGIHITLYPSE